MTINKKWAMLIKPTDSRAVKKWKVRFQKFIRLIPFIVVGIVLLGSAVVVTGASLAACKKKRVSSEKNEKVVNLIQFRRHKASGLCFAMYTHFRIGYLAHVPCERVKHLLVKK